LVFLRHGVGHK